MHLRSLIILDRFVFRDLASSFGGFEKGSKS